MRDYLLLAARFAAKAHEGQKRKYNGRAYIEHPFRVGMAVAIHKTALTAPIEAASVYIAAAFCHDLLEDTAVTYQELVEQIGTEAAEIVKALTHPPHSAGNRKARLALYRDQLKAAPEIVRIIKLLDRLDNLRDMPSPGSADAAEEKFLVLYAHESLELIEAIFDADPALAWEIEKESRARIAYASKKERHE